MTEKPKTGPDVCSECGSERATWEDRPAEYRVLYHCPDCGYEGEDCYVDLYGVMAAPHGFLC